MAAPVGLPAGFTHTQLAKGLDHTSLEGQPELDAVPTFHYF
jgi:hypothetical protein